MHTTTIATTIATTGFSFVIRSYLFSHYGTIEAGQPIRASKTKALVCLLVGVGLGVGSDVMAQNCSGSNGSVSICCLLNQRICKVLVSALYCYIIKFRLLTYSSFVSAVQTLLRERPAHRRMSEATQNFKNNFVLSTIQSYECKNNRHLSDQKVFQKEPANLHLVLAPSRLIPARS
jgi:hypothetical protein